MELIDLENIAQREKIDVINFKMRKTKARIINCDKSYIFMDYSEINTYTEEEIQEALSHLGENIIRAKGIVPTADGWLFFDYVPGDVDIRKGSAAYTGLITVIGEKVDVEEIKALFKVN